MSKFEGDRFIPLRPLNSSRLFFRSSNQTLFHQVLEEVLLGGEGEGGGWWKEGGGGWGEGGGWKDEGEGEERSRDEAFLDNIEVRRGGGERVGWMRELERGEEEEGERREGILKFSKRKKGFGLTIKEVYEKAEKISSIKKTKRFISTTAEKVLDAPGLINDFYLQPLTWHHPSNNLIITLGPSIYLYNCSSSKISLLPPPSSSFLPSSSGFLSPTTIPSSSLLPPSAFPSSLSSSLSSSLLSVGYTSGHLAIYDLHTLKPISIFSSNPIRIAALEWGESGGGGGRRGKKERSKRGAEEEEETKEKEEELMKSKREGRWRMEWEREEELEGTKVRERIGQWGMEGERGLLVSGGGDGELNLWDLRKGKVAAWNGHLEEVCRVRWEEGGVNLASGGNDNSVAIWDIRNLKSSRLLFKQHKSAVKAIAWCPWQRGLLATGGGSKDKTIKFFNTIEGFLINSFPVDSQVSGVIWNPWERELLTSHGFCKNQLTLWSYKKMQKIAELKGHANRILAIELGPDGECVASVGADESLRFWRVFQRKRSEKRKSEEKEVLR